MPDSFYRPIINESKPTSVSTMPSNINGLFWWIKIMPSYKKVNNETRINSLYTAMFATTNKDWYDSGTGQKKADEDISFSNVAYEYEAIIECSEKINGDDAFIKTYCSTKHFVKIDSKTKTSNPENYAVAQANTIRPYHVATPLSSSYFDLDVVTYETVGDYAKFKYMNFIMTINSKFSGDSSSIAYCFVDFSEYSKFYIAPPVLNFKNICFGMGQLKNDHFWTDKQFLALEFSRPTSKASQLIAEVKVKHDAVQSDIRSIIYEGVHCIAHVREKRVSPGSYTQVYLLSVHDGDTKCFGEETVHKFRFSNSTFNDITNLEGYLEILIPNEDKYYPYKSMLWKNFNEGIQNKYSTTIRLYFEDTLSSTSSQIKYGSVPVPAVISEMEETNLVWEKPEYIGYYYNNKFYSDSSHQTEITAEFKKKYKDTPSQKLYIYNGTSYELLVQKLNYGIKSSLWSNYTEQYFSVNFVQKYSGVVPSPSKFQVSNTDYKTVSNIVEEEIASNLVLEITPVFSSPYETYYGQTVEMNITISENFSYPKMPVIADIKSLTVELISIIQNAFIYKGWPLTYTEGSTTHSLNGIYYGYSTPLSNILDCIRVIHFSIASRFPNGATQEKNAVMNSIIANKKSISPLGGSNPLLDIVQAWFTDLQPPSNSQ